MEIKRTSGWVRIALALALATLCAMPADAAGASGSRASRRRASARFRGVPTFADSSKEDAAQFDDPVVRQAALDALGRYNGAVVAADPNTGRVLAVVNQKLAFSSGYIPCSTIKPAIALAGSTRPYCTRTFSTNPGGSPGLPGTGTSSVPLPIPPWNWMRTSRV